MSISSEPRSPWVSGQIPRDLAKPKPWLSTPDLHRGEARLDQVTGIADRTQFEARLAQEVERTRASGENFVIIFLDIDELSRVNDEHGCQMGNDAILLVARVLQENVRGADLIAHYGDDEFVVLMPEASLVRARDFFERTRKEVAARSEREFGFTLCFSAGALRTLDYSGNTGELLGAADYAMYLAKRRGRDRLFTTVVVARDDGKDGGHEIERGL